MLKIMCLMIIILVKDLNMQKVMTLLDECQEALRDDFKVVSGEDHSAVMGVLNEYPLCNGNVEWSKIEFNDYESIAELPYTIRESVEAVFVVADNEGVPIFKMNIKLLLENFYDVMALSPKVLVFNEYVMIQPLFPTDVIRISARLD